MADEDVYEIIASVHDKYQLAGYIRLMMVNPLHPKLPSLGVMVHAHCNRFNVHRPGSKLPVALAVGRKRAACLLGAATTSSGLASLPGGPLGHAVPDAAIPELAVAYQERALCCRLDRTTLARPRQARSTHVTALLRADDGAAQPFFRHYDNDAPPRLRGTYARITMQEAWVSCAMFAIVPKESPLQRALVGAGWVRGQGDPHSRSQGRSLARQQREARAEPEAEP